MSGPVTRQVYIIPQCRLNRFKLSFIPMSIKPINSIPIAKVTLGILEVVMCMNVLFIIYMVFLSTGFIIICKCCSDHLMSVLTQDKFLKALRNNKELFHLIIMYSKEPYMWQLLLQNR